MRRLLVREGVLHGGLPCLIVGTGPPLVVLRGLSADHRNPTGLDRRQQLRAVRRLADRFSVYLVGRRIGLPASTTMADLAADVAAAIRHDLGAPVPVQGVSTGGAIALRLAVDHPDVVERLVLACSARRLSPAGREAQRRLAEATEAGRPCDGWAAIGAVSGGRAGGRLLGGLLRLAGPWLDPDDPSDLLATIRAEDAFDAGPDLHRVGAPTLVVGGGRDGFYTPELFHDTVRGIPDARLVLYPRRGHGSVLTHPAAQRRILAFLEGRDAATRAV